MKKLNELSYDERRSFATLLKCWLKNYTDEVITRVMPKAEEIYNNEMAMKLLNELFERETKEGNRAVSDFEFYLMEVADDSFEKSLIHCNPLTHSKSYRDILHDMYISD